MNDIDSSEARQLLAQTLRCEDIAEWQAEKQQPDGWSCAGGLLHPDGVSARMQVQLFHRRSPKTGIVTRKMSVFRNNPWGLERVYQLEMRQSKKPVKDAHSKPHEHFGNARIVGDPKWSEWTFSDMLTYFCSRTKIAFEPPVQDPENFELKG